MRRLARLGIICLLITCAGVARTQEPASGLALVNELPVSGPQVTLLPTYGLHYRPGSAVVLEGQVASAEAEFSGGIEVREGTGEGAPRYFTHARFRSDAPTRFRIPVRAPAAGADLTLELWKDDPESGQRRVRFKAHLARVLEVVASADERLVWVVGASRWIDRPRWHAARLTGAQLPEQDWMYENADVVVLGQGAFDGAGEGALGALRRWLLRGGRVLIVGAGTLDRARRAGLTPLPAASERLPVDPAAWFREANLQEEDVGYDEGSRMVFARYRLGLGGGVFFFPWASAESMLPVWERALSSPELQPQRLPPNDRRIAPRTFDAFEPGAVASRVRDESALWALVGAAMMLAVLAWLRAERTRYMAAGLALGAIAALAAGLGQAFPPPELIVSRLVRVSVPADGRAFFEEELSFLEGLREPERLALGGPAQGTLRALHASDGELAANYLDLEARETGLHYAFRPVYPPPPPPLFLAQRSVAREAPRDAPRLRLAEANGARAIVLPAGLTAQEVQAAFGRAPRGAVLVRSDGSRSVLSGLWSSAGWTMEAAADDAAAWRPLGEPSSEASRSARGAALRWGQEGAGARLVVFDEGASGAPVLAEIEGLRALDGPRLVFWVLDVDLDRPNASGPGAPRTGAGWTE